MTTPHFIHFIGDESIEDTKKTVLIEESGNFFDNLKLAISRKTRCILTEGITTSIYDFFEKENNKNDFKEFLKEKLNLGKGVIIIKKDKKVLIVKKEERVVNKEEEKKEYLNEEKEEELKKYLINDILSKIEFSRIHSPVNFLNQGFKRKIKFGINKYLNLNLNTSLEKKKIILSSFFRKHYDDLYFEVYKKYYKYLVEKDSENEEDNIIKKSYKQAIESVSDRYIKKEEESNINNSFNPSDFSDFVDGLFVIEEDDDIIIENSTNIPENSNKQKILEKLSKDLSKISSLFFIEFGNKFRENFSEEFIKDGNSNLQINKEGISNIYKILSEEENIADDLINSLIENFEYQLLRTRGKSNQSVKNFFSLLKKLNISLEIDREIGIINKIGNNIIKDQLLKKGRYAFYNNKDETKDNHINSIFQKYRFLLLYKEINKNNDKDDYIELIRNLLKKAIKEGINKE